MDCVKVGDWGRRRQALSPVLFFLGFSPVTTTLSSTRDHFFLARTGSLDRVEARAEHETPLPGHLGLDVSYGAIAKPCTFVCGGLWGSLGFRWVCFPLSDL